MALFLTRVYLGSRPAPLLTRERTARKRTDGALNVPLASRKLKFGTHERRSDSRLLARARARARPRSVWVEAGARDCGNEGRPTRSDRPGPPHVRRRTRLCAEPGLRRKPPPGGALGRRAAPLAASREPEPGRPVRHDRR